MKTKEEILEGYFGSDYFLIKERDDLQYILRAMDEYAEQFKQKLNIAGISGKRPDCAYCMEPISERMIEEWTNWLRNARATCANGAVGKTVSVDMDKVIVKPPLMIYEHKSKPEPQ